MSHLFLFHLLFSMLVIPPQARKAEAPIASIQSLNRHAEAVNSHAGETSRSTLETDWRSSVILTGKELGLDYLEYPRLKILPDGSYLLFYQTRDQEVNKDHDGVLSAFSPDGRNWEPGPVVWEKTPVTDPAGKENVRYYATCDAILLQNGDLLAFAQFRLKENSLLYRKSWGVAMKRSKDLGRTWSEETILFRDRIWEPYAIQLPGGEIQLYLTHTNHDWKPALTDITLLRSFDNGYTWETHSPAMRFADGISTADRQSVDMPAPESEQTVHFTSQMPSAILLHDGKTVLTVSESVHMHPDHPADHDKRKLMLTLGWNNAAWPRGTLSGSQEGPEKITRNFVGGQAPYLAQFPSGETVLSYTGNWWYVRTGNEKGTDLAKAPFFSPMKLFARWGGLTVENDHTVLATSANVHKGADMKKIRDIAIATLRLNHTLKAGSGAPSVDGDNADWTDVDDAFFLGSESQAQCCFRFRQDKKNLYLCVDCLDAEVADGDVLDLYFSNGQDPSSIIRLSLAAEKGEISLGTQSAGMKAKNYPGEGYVAEIAIPKDRLPLAKGIFFNAVLTKGEMTDGFNFRTLDKVDNWFKIKL